MKILLTFIILSSVFLSCIKDLDTERTCSKNNPCFKDYICIDEICRPDLCKASPCKNNGLCRQDSNKFICNCTGTGYKGDTCEENINDCEPNPCSSGKICKDGINSYTCDCLNGFQDNDKDGVCSLSCKNPEINCLSEASCNDSTGLIICYACKENTSLLIDGVCKKLGIFVTQGSWTGDLDGVTGADEKCNSDAAKPEGNNYYKALIGLQGIRQEPSTDWPLFKNTRYYKANNKNIEISTTDFEAKFNIEGDSYRNTDDDTPLKNAISLNSYIVWTGLRGTGSVNASFGFCNNWDSNSEEEKGGAAQSDRVDYKAMSIGDKKCNLEHHLYCVEQACPQEQEYDMDNNRCISN